MVLLFENFSLKLELKGKSFVCQRWFCNTFLKEIGFQTVSKISFRNRFSSKWKHKSFSFEKRRPFKKFWSHLPLKQIIFIKRRVCSTKGGKQFWKCFKLEVENSLKWIGKDMMHWLYFSNLDGQDHFTYLVIRRLWVWHDRLDRILESHVYKIAYIAYTQTIKDTESIRSKQHKSQALI